MNKAAGDRDYPKGRLAYFASQGLAVLTGLLVIGLAIGPALRASLEKNGPKNDFASFFIGARLVGTGGLYDGIHVREEQAILGVDSGQHPLPFIRLPFCAVLYYPFGKLDYHVAYVVFQVLSLTSFVGAILLWRHLGLGLVLMTAAWSVPMACALLRGQDTPYWFLLVSLASVLLRSGRHAAAGLVMSLCLIKWHLLLALPAFVLGAKLWRFGVSFLCGCAIVLGVSFLAEGGSWPRGYLAVLLDPSVTPHVGAMPNIHGLVQGLPAATTIEVASALLVLALTWSVAIRAPTVEYPLAATLAGGLLVSRHAYLYDCLVLLPAIWVTLRQSNSSWSWHLGVLLATPCLYVLLFAPAWSHIAQLAFVILFVLIARAGWAGSRWNGAFPRSL